MSNPMQQDPIAATMSPLNGPDMALKVKSGELNPGGTFGEFMEQSFGIKWDDPMQAAMQKLKGAAQNATPQGKMQSIAGMSQGAGSGMPSKPMPQGRPMAAQGGLDSLMGGIR